MNHELKTNSFHIGFVGYPSKTLSQHNRVYLIF